MLSSWSKSSLVNIKIDQALSNNDIISLNSALYVIYNEYLDVELRGGNLVLLIILTLVLNIGLAIFFIKNEHKN